MTGDPDKFASPACSLDEAGDIYRGFLTPSELRQVIAKWQSTAPTLDIAAALVALLDPPDSIAPESSQATKSAKLTPERLRDEINALLPKVRDDKLHRSLQDIAGKL
jgi:hypothetical protein